MVAKSTNVGGFWKAVCLTGGQSLKLATTMAIHNPIMQFIIAMALSFLMYMALFFMEQASVGEFVGYLTAAFLLPRPIRQLSDANGDIQKGIAAAESLFDILDEPGEWMKALIRLKDARARWNLKTYPFNIRRK